MFTSVDYWTTLDDLDLIIVSDAAKCPKPERGIFDLFLSRANLRPDQCVFIDDKQSNVQAATDLGWRAVKWDLMADTAEQLFEGLKEQGVVLPGAVVSALEKSKQQMVEVKPSLKA